MSQATSMDYDQCEKDVFGYAKKPSPPPFLLKTYMLVEDPCTDKIISWNEDGTAFIVWHTDKFAKDLLPTLFKHSNFSSFVRQLNTYGFRKVATTRWEFYNDMFRKGERDLLCNIHRRKAWERKLLSSTPISMAPKEVDEEQGSSSTSSSSSSSSSSRYITLLNENKKLKNENEVLTLELTSVKNKCNELLKLVGCKRNMEQDESPPKLFGVRLEVQGDRKKNRPEDFSERIRLLLSKPS